MRIFLTFAFGLFLMAAMAQPTPAPKQQNSILIIGGTVHIGNSEVIEDAAVGFSDGIITVVGKRDAINTAGWGEVIVADGMHVYPGFIAPNSTLGLTEIDAVRATRDFYETGTFKPNVRAVIAYNTDNEITPTVRTNGVLLGQITPRGGVVSGTSGIVQFDAWNWEDAAIVMADGIHLNWPETHHRHWADGRIELKKQKNYDQQLREIERYFSEARAYSSSKSDVIDVKYDAMKGLFDGKLRLFIHANDIRQITEAVNFKNSMDIEHVVIVGGQDSYLLPELLKTNNVSVMVERLHSLPRFEDEDVDLTYRLPKLLQDAGVLFCLENEGDMEAMGTRNLPFYAGTAIGYGLKYEEAVQSITLNPAKILGIEDKVGSIEVGKQATLFISSGDALDMRTNDVTHAFIDGRRIDLDNRQKELYRKFRNK
jgi:imidazolonepropionase-like amidohydrolase